MSLNLVSTIQIYRSRSNQDDLSLASIFKSMDCLKNSGSYSLLCRITALLQKTLEKNDKNIETSDLFVTLANFQTKSLDIGMWSSHFTASIMPHSISVSSVLVYSPSHIYRKWTKVGTSESCKIYQTAESDSDLCEKQQAATVIH